MNTPPDPWNPNREQRPTGWRDGWLLALIVLGFLAYCAWDGWLKFFLP